MYIPATSKEVISVPVTGPTGVDLTQFLVSLAVIPDTGAEPVNGDYAAGTWINGEATLLVDATTKPAGDYVVWVRVVAAPEDVRRFSGRLRIGDART
jgi:hypothetical protein